MNFQRSPKLSAQQVQEILFSARLLTFYEQLLAWRENPPLETLLEDLYLMAAPKAK
ncbi:MAG: hypothetical protein ACUVRD_08970 [Bacteroidia bacterium]